MKTENLTKAAHAAELLAQDLHAAYNDANAASDAFACIVLLELLTQARVLQTKIDQAKTAATP